MSDRLYDVIKSGWMTKRSQNKNRFTPINYKLRWFELNKYWLTYYDIDDVDKRRERGRIAIAGVRMVELANLNVDGGDSAVPDGFTYQIGYSEADAQTPSRSTPQYTLYLLAGSEKERVDWIRAIRAVCEETNTPKSYRYHPGLWTTKTKKWLCCKATNRTAFGCQAATHWDNDNNISAGSSPTPHQGAIRTVSTSSILSAQFGQLHHSSGSTLGSNPAISPPHQTSSSAASNVLKSGPAAASDVAYMVNEVASGSTPGTPITKTKEVSPSTIKIVVALYQFNAIEGGDLSLEKNAEYEVIDDSQEHWWKVKDIQGTIGYIPSNYVKAKELLGLDKYDWYVGDMSRQRAESLLKQGDKEGCFVVRKSSTKGMYTLSLYTKVPQSHVKHYHIKQSPRNEYYLSEKHCCETIPDLVNYHRHNSGGLACRLKTSPCDRPAPPTAGLSHDKWEIHPSELMLLEELGSGQFGVVRRGKWRGSIDTAVKMMKHGTMSEDDFIEEAKVMTKLQHGNLVQLYGVCSKHRPIYIVTEYMKHGSLLNYLRRHEASLAGNMGLLLDMCIQVCKGMAYLERHNYIHRDLAARNCLVGSENTVKVADFGLARYVLDDQYTSSGGTKFPIKWAPPEVLNYTRFSSKSDVWAYGVLMWEVFTCGKMPYGRLKNTEVVERVQRGIILEKPRTCAKEIYDVMKKCWSHHPEERPSFRALKDQLAVVAQRLTE